MPLASGIIGALGAAANLGFGIYNAIRGQKAKTEQVGVPAGQQAALASSRYAADRMSEQGGLTAGQYQRALMEPDVQAAMTQQTVNQLATTPFQDSYQREALAKVMLSRMFAERERVAQNLMAVDAERTTANAFAAQQAQAQQAQLEAQAQAQRNAIIERNEQIKTNAWNNFARMIGGAAQLGGMSAEQIELALKDARGATAETTPAAMQTPIGQAAADRLTDAFNKTGQFTRFDVKPPSLLNNSIDGKPLSLFNNPVDLQSNLAANNLYDLFGGVDFPFSSVPANQGTTQSQPTLRRFPVGDIEMNKLL